MDEDEAYFAIDRARMEWTLTGQIHGLNAGESVVVVPKSSREAAEAERDGWKEAHDRVARTNAAMEAEVERLRAIIDRPDPHDFIEASAIEAKFQMDLWGTTEGFPTAFDGQEDHHFVYLIAYLVGKVAATPDDDPEKKLHRITTIAAAAANWHIVAHAALSPREDSER